MNNFIISYDEINTKCNLNKKTIIISDIHDDGLNIRNKYYDEALEIIKKEKPNYIIIPGDIINSSSFSITNLNNFIKNLGQICPTILSVGNHELDTLNEGCSLDWFYFLEKYKNVYPLNGKSKVIDDIEFFGFTPSIDAYKKFNLKKQEKIFISDFKKVKRNYCTAKYHIMLCHSPLFISENTVNSDTGLDNFNLFIAGHMHNGLTPIFLEKAIGVKGIVGPNYTFFPKNCRNIIKVNNSLLFVGKGFRKFTMENKFANVIDLKLFKMNIHVLTLK